jgi:hypothetical protein
VTAAHESYTVTVTPGPNAQHAAARLAKYIINRWMPGNAGGIHVMVTPQMAESLLPFFQRKANTILTVDTMGTVPEIREGKP